MRTPRTNIGRMRQAYIRSEAQLKSIHEWLDAALDPMRTGLEKEKALTAAETHAALYCYYKRDLEKLLFNN